MSIVKNRIVDNDEYEGVEEEEEDNDGRADNEDDVMDLSELLEEPKKRNHAGGDEGEDFVFNANSDIEESDLEGDEENLEKLGAFVDNLISKTESTDAQSQNAEKDQNSKADGSITFKHDSHLKARSNSL